MNFRELTDGRWVTVYAQTEIVKDLIAARLANGGAIEFSCSDVSVSGVTSDRPVLSYTDSSGVAHEVSCDVIAGCDGFHGVCRRLIPDLQVSERTLAALREVRRVLKPGAVLHLVEHGLAPDPRVARAQRRWSGLNRRVAGCVLDRDVAALVERAGLTWVSLDRSYEPGLPRAARYFYEGRAAA